MFKVPFFILKYILPLLLIMFMSLPAFANPTVSGNAEVYYYNEPGGSAIATEGDTATLTYPTWCDVNEEWTGWTATEIIIGHDKESNRYSYNDNVRNIKYRTETKAGGTSSWTLRSAFMDSSTYPTESLSDALFHTYLGIQNPQQHGSGDIWQRCYAMYTDYYTPYGEIYNDYPGGVQAVITLPNVYEGQTAPVKEVILEATAWPGVLNGDQMWGKFYIDKVIFENENGEQKIIDASSGSQWEPPVEVVRINLPWSTGLQYYDWPYTLSYAANRIVTAELYNQDGTFKESWVNHSITLSHSIWVEKGSTVQVTAVHSWVTWTWEHFFIRPYGDETKNNYFIQNQNYTLTADQDTAIHIALKKDDTWWPDPNDWPNEPPTWWPEDPPDELAYPNWPDKDNWPETAPENWPEEPPYNWSDYVNDHHGEGLTDVSAILDELEAIKNTLDSLEATTEQILSAVDSMDGTLQDILDEISVNPGSPVEHDTPSDGTGSEINYDDIDNPGTSDPTDYVAPTMPGDLPYTDPIPEAPPLPGVPNWELPGSWPTPVEGNPSEESTPSLPESPSNPSAPGTPTDPGNEVTSGTPTDPGGEVTPGTETGPGEPESPTQETNPNDPTAPTGPINPGGGLSPSQPIAPSEPIE